jgi:hypothetical protein
MAGAPSQLELFDYKPELVKYHGQDCPAEFLEGKKVRIHSGSTQNAWARRENLPSMVSRGRGCRTMCLICKQLRMRSHFMKAMHTDQFNHAPAQLLMHTGSARLGRPSLGAWSVYGLGSENQNLPGFIVLASGGQQPDAGKAFMEAVFCLRYTRACNAVQAAIRFCM